MHMMFIKVFVLALILLAGVIPSLTDGAEELRRSESIFEAQQAATTPIAPRTEPLHSTPTELVVQSNQPIIEGPVEDEIPTDMKNQGKRWKPEEDELLSGLELHPGGKLVQDIANKLGRTPGGVWSRYKKIRNEGSRLMLMGKLLSNYDFTAAEAELLKEAHYSTDVSRDLQENDMMREWLNGLSHGSPEDGNDVRLTDMDPSFLQ